MTIRFVELPGAEENPLTWNPVDVSYAATATVPAIGDTLDSDGTDPEFPEGEWDVVGRQFAYGVLGLETVYCEIRRTA